MKSGTTVLTICYLSSTALGGSMGSPVAGLLFDNFGFQNATIFIFGQYILLVSHVKVTQQH